MQYNYTIKALIKPSTLLIIKSIARGLIALRQRFLKHALRLRHPWRFLKPRPVARLTFYQQP